MVTVKNPTDSRRFYIGVRSCKVNPEEDKYFGSSKSFREWRKNNKDAEIVKQVLAIWKDRKSASQHEILLHDCFDVAKNPEFFNRSKALSSGFTTAGVPMVNKFQKGQAVRRGAKLNAEQIEAARLRKLGARHTEETKRKMSRSQTGRKWSDEQKQKLSMIHKGRKVSDETKDKIRKANTGKSHTEATRKKMSMSRSGEKYYNNGVISVRCLPELKPHGFVNGLLRRKNKNVYA
jgi:hypothetical protein